MDTSNSKTLSLLTCEALRRALRAWDSTKQLGELPLIGLRCVATQRLNAGYSDTVSGWGLALRETLQAAVEALKPAEGEFDPDDRRWRPYFILSEQYIHNRSPEWVAEQLCISRRTYYNEQEEALEAIVELLHQREELDSPQPPVEPAPTTELHPFLAPPRPHNLVGRQDELKALKAQLLSEGAQTPLALYGLPGVGKSSLAIELAHDPEILATFEDGVLWAGLGRQPDLPTLLNGWAFALGLPSGTIKPGDLNASARALHTALGMRRMLLIIDDAWEIESALVFRLGGPNCAILLTTRLANVALDFAGQGALRLHELDALQGLSLLEQSAPQAVVANLEAARSLVEAVGGLPLALVLIGRHLRRLGQVAQTRRLHEALDQLRQAETRLQLSQPQSPLERHPDLPTNIPCSLQTMIGLSEAALTAEVRDGLRALAYFPPKPNTFSEQAALAISGESLAVLDNLVDNGLVECIPPDRYTLHQTISDYLRLQGLDEHASQRYIAYFQRYLSEKATDYPALDLEFNNLLTALELAASNQSTELVQLTLALHPYLLNRGFYKLDSAQLARAEELAHRFGDKAAMARIQIFQGQINIRLGNYDAAREVLQSGIELARSLSLPLLAADGLHGLGNVFYYTGEYELARQHLHQALESFRQGDSNGETRALNSLGLVAYEQGFFDEAKDHLEQALTISRSTGNREITGMALSNLGLVLADLGEYSLAVNYHRQALEMCRESGNIRLEGNILDNLSFALTQLGQLNEAKTCYERALRIFRQVGNQPGEATALAFLGGLLQMIGDPAAALEHSQQALNVATTLKEPYTQSVALTVSGQALTDLERPQEAEADYHQAVILFQENGQPHLVIEPQTGLAHLAWQTGDLPSALEQVEPVLAYLDEKVPTGTLDPFWIYLTCYKILHAAGDGRAPSLLERAYVVLMNQAEKIADPVLRQAFLEKVPSHREVQVLFRALQSNVIPPSHGSRRRSG